MKQKRKRYSGALKAKVGLEALMGVKTTAQIAREHQVQQERGNSEEDRRDQDAGDLGLDDLVRDEPV